MNIVKSHKAIIWITSLVVLLLAGVILSLNMGKMSLNPFEVLQVLLGQGPEEHHLVVYKFRLPRIVLAILVGFGMALAGAVMQALLRNDLADPGMLGISSGSGLMVLLIISTVSLQSTAIALLLPFMAFVGGLLAAILIYVLAYRKHRMISSTRLVLTGVAINVGLSALTLFMTLKLDDQKYEFAQRWQAGYLWGDKWSYIGLLLPWVLILFLYIISNARILNVMVLGNEPSIGLGVDVKGKFLRLSIAAVGIASSCVALGGSIFFIGLISPHVARKLVGQNYKVVLPASALIGAILLLAADTIARTISFKTDIPAGIIVTMLSVPYFLYLLMRSK
ncbi:FecCD family ABC transporter permease [Paenibacillus endoradicis]|uniref:FecCD family ABC transporter permease n=1 Tax=Paenibacillus endoradicis TaxID=2972487 RepID=UPI002159A390|nr:iron ABC transporter permease [Paenibacillus endoradicis]MCR8659895.1 iron ABC transporter permease [Paenibacillus endoradicis]